MTVDRGSPCESTLRIASDRWTWVVAVLLYCIGGVNPTLIGLWIPYVVQVYDVSVTAASTITLLGGVGTVVGPPVFGRLSDVVDRRTEFIIGGAIVYTSAVGLIAMIGDPPLIAIGVVFFLIGGLLGTFVLTYPTIRHRYDDRASGIALGTINRAAFSGAASFPTLTERALDIYLTGEHVCRAAANWRDDVSSGMRDREDTFGTLVVFYPDVVYWLNRLVDVLSVPCMSKAYVYAN